MINLVLSQHFARPSVLPLDDKEVHWGIKDILKLFGLYMLIFLLLPVPNKFSPLRVRFTDWGAMLIVVWAYRYYGYWPSYEYFGLRLRDFKSQLATGVVWGIAIKAIPTILMILLVTLIAMITQMEDFSGNNPLPSIGRINIEWSITAFHVGIVAPIVEEIIFRGLIHTLLRKRYGLKAGIVLSSLFFGIMHGFSLVAIFATLAGVGFALLYEKTGSLAPCMIAHAVGNLTSVVFSALQII